MAGQPRKLVDRVAASFRAAVIAAGAAAGRITEAVRPGQLSFDERAYLRVRR